MEELFRKVIIKSEEDLPKEEGEYYVKKKDSFRLTTMIFKPDHPNYIKDWLFDYEVEWYFLPLSIDYGYLLKAFLKNKTKKNNS